MLFDGGGGARRGGWSRHRRRSERAILSRERWPRRNPLLQDLKLAFVSHDNLGLGSVRHATSWPRRQPVQFTFGRPVKMCFCCRYEVYRAVQVDDAGDSWSVLVSEDGGPYEWLPVTYHTFAAAEGAIVRLKQAEAGATFSRDRAATPVWIRQRRFCF